MSQACCQQAQLVLVHSTSVEGSNLVSSATRDVVGLLQHDSPNSRSNSETNRCPNGDGPSNSRVACLRKDSLVVPFKGGYKAPDAVLMIQVNPIL